MSPRGVRFVGCCLLVAAACVATSGCSFGGSKWKFARWQRPEFLGGPAAVAEPETPTRMVATWTDAILNRAGQPSQRGFGGRLIFFKADSQDPVRVDGQLVIYAFDETDRAPHDTQPTRRFIFPREQMALQESPSTLGPSYSVWLPWDDVGGPQKKISLIARFEPEGGPLVLGEQTAHLLPGAPRPEQQLASSAEPPAAARRQAAGQIQPASFEAAVAPVGAERSVVAVAEPLPAASDSAVPSASSALTTMTVPLPRKLGSGQPTRARSLRDLRSMPTPTLAGAPLTAAGAAAAPEPSATASPATAVAPPVAPPVDRAQQLRDSVRATHPARATLGVPPTRDRAG